MTIMVGQSRVITQSHSPFQSNGFEREEENGRSGYGEIPATRNRNRGMERVSFDDVNPFDKRSEKETKKEGSPLSPVGAVHERPVF